MHRIELWKRNKAVKKMIWLLLPLMTFAAWSFGQNRNAPPAGKIRKPQMSDSIKFIPHNVVSVDLLPSYPMTIAVMAKDNADPKTGMEYANTNIGDGGFILKFGDGTVTNAKWKVKKFSWGPIDRDTNNPRVENLPIPENWFAVDFDDSQWGSAKEYTEQQVGPKQPYFEHDFQGAKFIWTDDIELDNTVIFRHVVKSPPDGKLRLDFSNLNSVVPDSPPKKPRR